ncbi:hypothetical protein PIB30_069486 [Stylosanthes scabra]|uniref:Uncharacterized protein n=1 Tax=Stylosanthes scabra TaxID=79078 RepID=A0ABU6QP39_9FABA|nr:hypothetical protein [Stylosanthes scabra]
MESVISNQILLKEKLGFFGIVKEAAKIPFKNPNFIIFTSLTLLPLLYSLSIYESMFTQTIIEASKALKEEAEAKMECDGLFCFSWSSLVQWRHVINLDHFLGIISQKLVILVLSHIGILHLCDLFSTIATVNSSSELLYARHKADSSLKEMFTKHLMDARLKGPLITSIYTMLFASVSSMGLCSLFLYVYVMGAIFTCFMIIIFLIMFFAILGMIRTRD